VFSSEGQKLAGILSVDDPNLHKRRTRRVVQAVPLTVAGVDALGQPFRERTSTLSISCHGCKYQSKHYVPKGNALTLEIPRAGENEPPRVVQGKVAWVMRPKSARELFQIGVQLLLPGNVWGIAFPPADWFPYPEESSNDIPGYNAPAPAASGLASAPGPVAVEQGSAAPVVENVPGQQMAMAREMAKLMAEAKQSLQRAMDKGARAAVSDEIRAAREQLQAQMREAIEKAVQESVARVAEQAIQQGVQEAMERVEKQAAAHQADARPEPGDAPGLTQAQENLMALLSSRYAELEERTEHLVTERAQRLEPALDAAAKKCLDRFAVELEQEVTPQLARAKELAAGLTAAQKESEQILASLRGRLDEAADQALKESLERLHEQTRKIPAEVEKAYKSTLAKMEEELEARSTEVTHNTSESLYKTSDWYQKKAQTNMQAALEKSLEQAAESLRDQAAEISRLAVSELEHYSRSYVEHTRGMLEETTREGSATAQQEIRQAAETAAAAFGDDLHRVARSTLDQFESSSRKAIEQAHTELGTLRDKVLAEMQKRLDERAAQGVTRASETLQGQINLLVEKWRAQYEEHQREWLARLERLTNESLDEYRGRLENVSNPWLVASAATLTKHSEAVLQALGKAAEAHLRETCAEVFAGVGETLRQRLLGLSSGLGPVNPPSEK
jgi:hypothetical protein